MSRDLRLSNVTFGVLILAGLVPACGDLDVVTIADGSSSTTAYIPDDTGDTGDSSGSETGDDPDQPPPELGGPARGLTLVSVEINQGTGVIAVQDDEPVAIDQRNATLIRDRDTLIRVAHVIDDPSQWIPRNLTGILHIQPPDGGEELTRIRTFMVEEDSDPRRLTSGFFFSILAAEAQPGTEFWVELRESDAAVDVSVLGPGRPNSPVAELGLVETPLEIHVVLVPVQYEYLDPPREPEIEADDLQLFHDALLQQNPVQTVVLEIRDQPIVWTNQLTNLGSLLGPTRAAKLADNAGPNVYYHALVDVGGPSVNMVAGIAMLTDASKQDSSDRVAATVYHKQVSIPDEDAEDQTPTVYPPVNSSRTFVHEVGHNQGFSHIACPNANAAGPDPSYPYVDGKIGVYGFGIRDFHVYTPGASHDYMSYCGNAWVSDWTWNKALARIEALTSWDQEAPSPPPVTMPVLVGVVSADGSAEWTVSIAEAPAGESDGATDWVEYSVDGAIAARVPARVQALSDDATVLVTAPLPLALTDVDAIIHERGGARAPIDVARLRSR